MSPEELTIVYKLDTFDAESALQGIQSMLTGDGVPLTGFKLYEEPSFLPDVLDRLKQAKRKTFHIVGRGFEFDLSCVRNFQVDFLSIKAVGERARLWDNWASRFIANPAFVMAWLADSEYQHWQNAYDPLQYTAVGRSYAHLPMKSNGLPYPLEQQIIDTSANPGRWKLCIGYHEAIGALMWLGEPFWRLTGADPELATGTSWLRISKPFPSVIRLEAAEECFRTANGVSGEVQRKLRSLLFPRECKSEGLNTD
jgi:hypothetical protein